MSDVCANNILCLDLSLNNTGWCVFDQLGGLLGYGTIPKFNSFGNTEWLMHINNCVKTLIKDYFVGMVVLEDVYYIKNIKTYKELCFLSGTVQATCYEHVGNNIFVLPTTFVRSKLGVKSKNEVFELIVNKFNLKGFVFNTHNDICDSIALGLSFMDRKALFKTASMLKIEKALGIPLEDYIVREYWTNEKTIDSIAKDIKVGYSTLHSWFSNLKIPIKTRFFNYDKFPSSLTYDQEQVLLGTVLGDGGLYKSNTGGGSYHLQITHSLDQRAYLEHKAEFFAVYLDSLYDTTLKDGSYRSVFRTIHHPLFNDYAVLFYENGKKRVSLDILNRLDPLGVSIWYMDDGNYYHNKQETISIATHCFSKEENDLMADWFKKRFDIAFRVTRASKDETVYYYLRSGKKSEISKFIDLVTPYITKSMRYKIKRSKVR